MSSVTNIRPPESFNFQEPGKWTSWFKRFERFRIASGLMKESGEIRINTLIYVMGVQSKEILNSLRLTETELKSISISSKLQSYFIPKRNLTLYMVMCPLMIFPLTTEQGCI